MRYFIFIFIILGCTHQPLKNFQKVERGMDKGRVIHLLGGPQRSIRFDGKDIWLYRFYQKETWVKKEVSFKNGFVDYFGPPKTKRKRTTGSLSKQQQIRVWPWENSKERLRRKIKNNNIEILGEKFISIEEFNSSTD